MNTNVLINGINLYTQYGITLTHKEISEAQPKRNVISIPLTDGTIDLTKSLSPHSFFENRTITMVFEIMKQRKDWSDTITSISNYLHAESVKVSFADDENYFWDGIAFVGSLEDHGSTASLTIEVDAKPFKRTINIVHEENVSVSGTKNVIITNDHKRSYLNIVPTTQMNVTVNGEIHTITAQKHDVEFILIDDETAITLSGNGSARLVLYGGDL